MKLLILLSISPLLVAGQPNPAFVMKSNLIYSKMESSGEGLFGFEKEGKFGYMDKNGKEIIPPSYSYENSYSTIPAFYKGYVRVKKDGKYGIMDKTGKIVIPFDYESLTISRYVNSVSAGIKKEGATTLYGMINLQNKILLPFEYESISTDSNLYVVKKSGKYGLVDNNGKILFPAEYTSLSSYSDEKVLKAEKDGKYGFIDLSGKWLFEKPKSVYTLYSCSQGMISCLVNSKYGFLDMNGNEAIITRYDYSGSFEKVGLAKVGKKISTSSYSYQYGYIDKKGTEVIPLKYETIGNFNNGLVYVKDPETNRYGYMDRTGKWVINPTFLVAFSFDDLGGAWVKMTDAKYHYINKTGKDLGTLNETGYKNFNTDGYAVYENTDYPYVLIDKSGKTIKKIEDCDGIYSFAEGIAGYKCKTGGKYGFLDTEGNKIVSCDYDGFDIFSDGLIKVNKKIEGKTKYGYIDKKGTVIIPIVYENAQNFRNGWGIIKKDSNYFFIDKNGNLKEPPREYDELSEFRSGYALGKIKGAGSNSNTYYYINPQLKEEFSVEAFQAYLFWEDVAVVSRDNKTYELMNKKGEIFKTLTGIETLKFTNDGLLAIKENGKWGYMNQKAETKVTPKYDDCESFKYGYAKVKLGTKWGIIDKSGTEIIEPKYENIVSGENGIFSFYDKAWGALDKTGKIIVEPTLSTITPFEKDRALARQGKTYTLLKSPLAK